MSAINLTKIVGGMSKSVVADADVALAIVSQAMTYVEWAEEVYAGLKGNEKLAAVQAAMESFVEDLGLSDRFAAIWRYLKPVISMVVTVYHLAGIFSKKAS